MKTTLGEIATWGSGGTPRRSVSEYFGDGVPWLSIADLTDGVVADAKESLTPLGIQNSAAKVVPPGTLLVAMYGSIGKLGITSRPMCTSQAIAYAVPDPKLVDTRFLFHFLMSQRPHLLARGRGGTQMNISQGDLREWPISLPPLDEQRRIAAILDHADALRAKRVQSVMRLETLIPSIFDAMFGGRSDRIARLGDLVDLGDRLNYGVVQPGAHVPGGVPLIRVSDLTPHGVHRQDLKRVAPEVDSKHRRSRIRGTEVLISCVGSIGVVCETSPADVGSNIARAVARIPVSDPVLRYYLAAYLRADAPQRHFVRELRTVSQPTLNVRDIAGTRVPLPPVSLMQTFFERGHSAHSKVSRFEAALSAVESLGASLQSRAFSGRL